MFLFQFYRSVSGLRTRFFLLSFRPTVNNNTIFPLHNFNLMLLIRFPVTRDGFVLIKIKDQSVVTVFILLCETFRAEIFSVAQYYTR
jgi:hypothetical protein